jgi:transcriptional antiterminator
MSVKEARRYLTMDSLFFVLIENKQLKRQMQLLELLYDADGMVSINEISCQLGITRKTVINDVETLIDKLPEDIHIIRERRGCVKLLRQKDFSIEDFIRDLVKETVIYRILDSIFHGTKKNIKQWEKELFISNTSLRHKINYANRILKHFQLKLSSYTVELIGNEVDIRFFYYTFFKEFRDLFVTQNQDDEYVEIFTQIISGVNKANIPVLSLGHFPITLWMTVVKERLLNGNYITLNPELVQKISKRKSFLIVKNVYEKVLEKNYQIIDLPLEESIFAYITCLHCVEYKTHKNTTPFFTLEEETETLDKINLFLKNTIHEFHVDESQYNSFIDTHQAFLANMNLLSQQSELFQYCPSQLKKHIKSTHPVIYEKWINILKNKNSKLLFPICLMDDLCVTLTMLTTSFLLEQSSKIKHILLSFRGDLCYTNYFKAICKKLITDTIKCTYMNDSIIDQHIIDELKIDLFVSNYNDHITIKRCKKLQLSYIPTGLEWLSLKNHILDLEINME